MTDDTFGNVLAGNRQKLLQAVLPLTALTLFLSAFLLFSVQPFFAKMVLPKLGGSPAVWSVAMVFFQAMLLAGYGYAHVLTTKLSLKWSVVTHLAVLFVAFIALPIAIPESWHQPPADGQAVWLIGLFAASVGLPFFAVSANGPLLQAWFAKTGHSHAEDPYFLYGASNIGSFASLILYIVMIEPLLNLSGQSQFWTAGFALLAILIAACGYTTFSLAQPKALPGKNAALVTPAVSISQWLKWIALSFIPSALLVAVTAHVSTDVAAAPFLWIIPLALFLLTFVIVFQKRPMLKHETMLKLMPVFAVSVMFLSLTPFTYPIWLNLGLHFVTFFIIAMAAHGTLVKLRPQAAQLTEFYFAMSIGGVLGGIFASLLAMQFFTWIAEYPLLLMSALLIHPKVRGAKVSIQLAWSLAAAGGVIAFLYGLRLSGIFDAYATSGSLVAINLILMLAAVYFLIREPKALFPVVLAIFANTWFYMEHYSQSLSERSFFGVVKVEDLAKEGVRKFKHGTTLHGAMRLQDSAPSSGKPMPLTYYTSDGGLNLAMMAARQNAGGILQRTAIVGVGAGSLSCQLQANETADLIEIDPLVFKIANDPTKFRFLSECGQNQKQHVGDGRLVMEGFENGTFDVVVVDAFSSDAIPVHMMTAEAIGMFVSKLKPEGLLVMHISNKHMELESVVAATAKSLGYEALAGLFTPANTPDRMGYETKSRVAVLARNKSAFGVLNVDPSWHIAEAGNTSAWTDGYSNLISAIWREYTK